MNVPRPNLAIFDAHPPPPPEVERKKRGRPKKIKPDSLQVENARKRTQHRAVEDSGAWVERLPGLDRGPRGRNARLVELLQSRAGVWRRLREVRNSGGYNTLRRLGCQVSVRIDTDGKRYVFARWPEGAK